VPLAEVLRRAGISDGAQEIVFRGIDSGAVEGLSESIRFERSLSVDDARGKGVLLAYAMNGAPLPLQHGYPLRVIVPGWYAVASVKWLTEIEVIGAPFEGHYQTDTYIYEWQRNGRVETEPVTVQRIRSLIAEPEAGAEIERGDLTIRGVAWSGAAPIERVEVSIGGQPWREARLVGERREHSWQWWELHLCVETPGAMEIRVRATDTAGRTQPEAPEWNRLGYGNNSVQSIRVQIG
jgi:DMSO/TMAO reductase YedYZ molybdopterin-dependent catalytic subunit